MAKLLIDAGANVSARSHLGYTPIRNAVYSGKLELVKIFLDCDASNINDVDHYGTSLLYIACLQNNHKMVSLLLEMGAIINQPDFMGGKTALHIACSFGSKTIVSTLLKTSLCEVNAKTHPEGWTPLYWSVYIGRLDIIAILLESGSVDVDLKSDDEQLTPLYNCVSNTMRTDILQKLIDYGANINMMNGRNQWTCLQKASFMGKKDIVCWLCDHGAAIENLDSNGHSALTLAYEKNHMDIVDLLLLRGAYVDSIHPLKKCTLLWDAVVSENFELATILVKYKANIHCSKIEEYARIGKMQGRYEKNEREGEREMCNLSLMDYACQSRNLEILKFLLSNGFDLETRFRDGNTSLHIMSTAGYVEGINTLLAAGISIHAENNEKETSLHIACRYGHVEAVNALILSDPTGCDHFNGSGHTPLHVAILSSSSIDLLVQFYKQGANFHQPTLDDSTVLHLICENIKLSKALLSSDSDDAEMLTETFMPTLLFFNSMNRKNEAGRTPLHIACAVGNSEIISKCFEH